MTAAEPGRRRRSELALRVVSGLVMIAAALLAAWAGGIAFAIFWTLAGVAVGVEWAWLAAQDASTRRRSAAIVAFTLGVAGALTWASGAIGIGLWPAAAALVAGGVLVLAVARPAGIVAFAVPYGAAAFLGVLLLRRDSEDGLLATFWLFAVVWATDIAAYFTGRTLGGPKLAPRISPNKTWSGAIGGAIAGVAAGVGVAAYGDAPDLWPVAAVALLAAIATEVGDLFESGAKRAFGAKDSGHIIPGHGGLMDRLDGFLVAATLVATIGVWRGGLDAAGQGLLRW